MEERSEPRGLSTTSRDSVREHNLQQNESARHCLNKPKFSCVLITLTYVHFGAGSNNQRLRLTTTEMSCTLLQIISATTDSRYVTRHITRKSKFTQSLLPQFLTFIRRGADKSLARPGRKQATATKLNILPTKLNTLLSPLL